jgi:uncharacterized protein YegL
MAEQFPFMDLELASNPEPRCPCVLLLDTSGSMAGQPIASLNLGLKAYQQDLLADSLAAQRVEVAIVTFGGRVEVAAPFVGAEHFNPPILRADGDTPMGAAILQGIELVTQRKQTYKQSGLHYFRPWIFLITDGAPTDTWLPAAERVRQGEAAHAFAFFCVGVEGANLEILSQIAVRSPLKLQGLSFREMFVWLSQSQRTVSRSQPGEEERVQFTNPTAPGGWASL